MKISYHNHTHWSDGTASLHEMIEGARQAKLDEFGISDHFVLFPDGRTVDWAMPLDFLAEYVAQIRRAAEQARDVAIRLGIEVDFFPETVREVAARLACYPFDYIIGSVHFIGDFPIDAAAEDWAPLSQHERNEVWRLSWVRLRELANSGLCDFVGHLDLPKKFGYLPTVDLTAEITAALDAIARAGIAIEINTAGWNKPIGEAYPSEPLLRQARMRKIPLVINADAHAPEHVACHYERARELAHRAGYTEQSRFDRRTRIAIPL